MTVRNNGAKEGPVVDEIAPPEPLRLLVDTPGPAQLQLVDPGRIVAGCRRQLIDEAAAADHQPGTAGFLQAGEKALLMGDPHAAEDDVGVGRHDHRPQFSPIAIAVAGAAIGDIGKLGAHPLDRALGHTGAGTADEDRRPALVEGGEQRQVERRGIEAEPPGIRVLQPAQRPGDPDPVGQHEVEAAQEIEIVDLAPGDRPGSRIDEGEQEGLFRVDMGEQSAENRGLAVHTVDRNTMEIDAGHDSSLC